MTWAMTRPSRITLVPHTHWDREWYQPFDEFLARLVPMMDLLLELGEQGFPHFHLDGQTAMVDDYLTVRPEREDDLRRLAASGRLSLGPWVTQMDEFLTSGESHIRNLEMGLERARELGPATEIGYLPDQFGHIGQMPQILRMFGLGRAVVWRGVPAEIDRTAFSWESPDGSRVRTEYLPFGYSLGADLHQFTEPADLAEELRLRVARVEPMLAGDRMLITVGSDHAGPDPTLPDRVAAADRLMPEAEVRIGSLAEHFDGGTDVPLPAWRGELRSSARAHLLPNVYSARVHQKRERGRIEALLERYAEPLAALVPEMRWPGEELRRAWTLLLWNGAHDSACGCSHDQVARDVDARYAEARRIAESVAQEALDLLAGRASAAGVIRFNPSPFDREGVPGLGWHVERPGSVPRSQTIDLALDGDWIRTENLEFTLRDEPDVGDLYNFCFADPDQPAVSPVRLTVTGTGEVEAEWNGLAVRIAAHRRDADGVVRLEGRIQNDRPDHRLRLHVRLAQHAEGSIAGSPFELVARGLVSEGSELELPSRTWPARGVVFVDDVTAFHEGVFEYEVADKELCITLLRCVGTISRETMPTRPWAAGPDVATPDAQMIGETSFLIGLQTGARQSDLLPTWERFALPILETPAAGGGTFRASGSLLEIEGAAVLSSIRQCHDKIEVRLWNPDIHDAALAMVSGRRVRLAPARIETINL
jgi:hypothetical protein